MTAPDLYRDWTPPPDRCPVCCGEPVLASHRFDYSFRVRCSSCGFDWEDVHLWAKLDREEEQRQRELDRMLWCRCIIAPLTPPASTAPPPPPCDPPPAASPHPKGRAAS